MTSSSGLGGFVCKTIIFIRHGESEGNICEGGTIKNWCRDPHLTAKGRDQAEGAKEVLARHRNDTDATAADRWLLVVSPFKRTLETAQLVWPEAFTSSDMRFQVTPEVREFMCGSDDIGSPASVLKETFPQLGSAFDSLPDAWWGMPEGVADDASLSEVWLSNPLRFQLTSWGWGMWDGDAVICKNRGETATIVEFEGKHMMLSDPRPGAVVVTPRLASALEYLANQPEDYIVVVAHSAFIHRVLQCLNIKKEPPANCEVYTASNVSLPFFSTPRS